MGGSVGNSSQRGERAESDQLKRSRNVSGGCPPCPIKVLSRPPRAPWEDAPAGSLKPGQHDDGDRKGEVQGSAGEGRHGICEMPGSLSRRPDGGPPMEGDLRQKPQIPQIARHGGTSWRDVPWQWLPARNHPPARYILHKDGMELSHPHSGALPGTD